MDLSAIERLAKTHHPKKFDGYIQYGTAGFRTKADTLNHVLFRMGLLAVLRSRSKKAAIGLMITASHNPEDDNGVKLVDPAGEMLEASWEKVATKLANVADSELVATLREIIEERKIDANVRSTVVVGRDTRRSSPALRDAVVAGITALGGTVEDFGTITTPQLHYLVVCINTNGAYGEPTLNGYYRKLGEAFARVHGGRTDYEKYVPRLYLDGANGVGAVAMAELKKHLGGSLSVEIYNDGSSGELNRECGADHVKVQQAPPSNVPLRQNVRCVSIDGDADRVVYCYVDENGKFHLLDGDRIATLIAGYLKELVDEAKLSLRLGLVQTAYANGGSTDYITNTLKVPVVCSPTGVKHLHHLALEFDVGVYFEANGHGTVVFKEGAIDSAKSTAANSSLPQEQRDAASKLADISNVINQAVGDALSDMLVVETILHSKDWDLVEWEKSYDDLPNKQLKVKVKDRNVITTADAERKCVTPSGLQSEIDALVRKYPKGRAFIRPSGTEDVVRVYAEGQRSCDVEKLAAEVSLVVYKLAGGVGPEPVIPNEEGKREC